MLTMFPMFALWGAVFKVVTWTIQRSRSIVESTVRRESVSELPSSKFSRIVEQRVHRKESKTPMAWAVGGEGKASDV